MADEEKGVMDESLASEAPADEPVEAEETEEVVEEEQDETKEQVKNLNRAFAEMRRENKRLREYVEELKKPKTEEKPEDEFPVDDEAYLKAGDVKKLVKAMTKPLSAPKSDKAVLADTLNASEQIAMLRHEDYAEVVEEFRAELDDDPALQAFIIGTPGTHMNAGERLYQFALMRRGQNNGGSRRETIEAVVSKKKKPVTMGMASKKTGSATFSPAGKTIDEIREFKKKNPDAYRKIMGEGGA